MINLKDATPIGEKLFKPTLIAKNADPHIAERIINRIKLFTWQFLDKN